MIKNLQGFYEHIDYIPELDFILYRNTDCQQYPVHWHNAIEIICPTVNSYTVFVGKSEYKLEPTDILFISAGDLHEMPPQAGERLICQLDCSVLNALGCLRKLSAVLSQTIVVRSGSVLHSALHAKLSELADEYAAKQLHYEAAVLLKLTEMLLLLVRSTDGDTQRGQGAGARGSKQLMNAIHYIDNNLQRSITLDEAADIAGFSKYHFSRLFGEYTGQSFKDYVNSRRIKLAERLLADPSQNITEVAMKAGFNSITSFNRVFKQKKDCTPTKFQRLYNKDLGALPQTNS